MTQVLAISGMMGSGKSTLVANLQARLPDSVALFEDDFNQAPLNSVMELQAWWARGGHVDEFDLTALSARIDSERAAGCRFVLLETQFGRLHSMLRPLIDMQCWIDIEPDVAFARKVAQLSRQMAAGSDGVAAPRALRWITDFCDSYLQTTREMFARQRVQVSGQSDMTICGTRSQSEVCDAILQLLPGELLVSGHADSVLKP